MIINKFLSDMFSNPKWAFCKLRYATSTSLFEEEFYENGGFKVVGNVASKKVEIHIPKSIKKMLVKKHLVVGEGDAVRLWLYDVKGNFIKDMVETVAVYDCSDVGYILIQLNSNNCGVTMEIQEVK